MCRRRFHVRRTSGQTPPRLMAYTAAALHSAALDRVIEGFLPAAVGLRSLRPSPSCRSSSWGWRSGAPTLLAPLGVVRSPTPLATSPRPGDAGILYALPARWTPFGCARHVWGRSVEGNPARLKIRAPAADRGRSSSLPIQTPARSNRDGLVWRGSRQSSTCEADEVFGAVRSLSRAPSPAGATA